MGAPVMPRRSGRPLTTRRSVRLLTHEKSRARGCSWSPTTARCLAALLLAVVMTLAPAASGATSVSRDDDSTGWAEPGQSLRSVVLLVADGLKLASRSAGPADGASARDGRAPADAEYGAVWEWPLTGQPRVVHRFEAPAQRWLPGHRGIDLGGVAGDPVRAVADGFVAFSGVIAGVGIVSVQHADGLRSTYQPVRDRLARGVRVGSGQVLGALDTGGHCLPRTCLHLGAKRGEDYLDPMLLLQGWQVSLLPLD